MNSTDSTESDAALRELIAKCQANDPYLITEIYAFRNQSDEAFEWLDELMPNVTAVLSERKLTPY